MTRPVKLSQSQRLRVLHRHRGLLQRVAQRCEVHPSLVSKVFHGKARSARVERELERALVQARGKGRTGTRHDKRAVAAPVQGYRAREFQWLREHGKEYGGHWVALDGDRLVASGTTAKPVFLAARQSGADPLIHYVEPLDALPFGGW